MTLADLIARLGLAELARRVGVRQTTVRRWLLHGISPRGAEVLKGVAARHLRSKRATQTRKKRAVFRERLPAPPEPYKSKNRPTSGLLTPEQVLPRKPPVETEAQLEAARISGGHEGDGRIDTDFYLGESTWMQVGQAVSEVDFPSLTDQVIRFWQDSGRTWCHVIFLFFRYIPFNPLYSGELLAKQGKWFDWWSSTKVMGTVRSIATSMEDVYISARNEAYRRMIWLEAVKVRVFDNKEDLPGYADIMGRQLR